MELVKETAEIRENMDTVDNYLDGRNAELRNYAIGLIKAGRCFTVRCVYGKYRFYPSRFIGYRKNTMSAHENNADRDGRDTNQVITKILHCSLTENVEWEEIYEKYCTSLGVTANKYKHTFWL